MFFISRRLNLSRTVFFSWLGFSSDNKDQLEPRASAYLEAFQRSVFTRNFGKGVQEFVQTRENKGGQRVHPPYTLCFRGN